MKKYKVLYLINFAPNYRDKFLVELAKHVDLTVAAYPGFEANLTDPEDRKGYRFIELSRKKFLGFNLNTKEFTLANEEYDVVIVGYTLWNPLRMINLMRRRKRVICEGLIYGRSNSVITKLLRNVFINSSEGILVYSKMVEEKLSKTTRKPIIVFNNTSYYKHEIKPIPLQEIDEKLNIVWVGRYQKRKKVERLYEFAKFDKRVSVRLVGPGIKEVFEKKPKLDNFQVYDSAFGKDLERHFAWSHIVFNPGGAGLIVMNAARFGRSVVVDNNSYHGPEVQLAIDANQDFINFSDLSAIKSYVDKVFNQAHYLQVKSSALTENMDNYTIEHMVERYLDAIKGKWS